MPTEKHFDPYTGKRLSPSDRRAIDLNEREAQSAAVTIWLCTGSIGFFGLVPWMWTWWAFLFVGLPYLALLLWIAHVGSHDD